MKILFDAKPVKMREYREAITSNDAARELMSKHAYDEQGNRLDQQIVMDWLDEMTLLEFAQTFREFQETALPK